MTGARADGTVHWRHSDAVAHIESPDRVALVSLSDLATPPMLLTDTAAFIWSVLDGERDVSAVVAQTAEHFGVESEAIRGDVVAFLEDLATRKLIEPSIASPQ